MFVNEASDYEAGRAAQRAYIQAWFDELITLLNTRKVREFKGQAIPFTNIEVIKNPDSGSADVTADVVIDDKVTFHVYFSIRDNGYSNDDPKYVGEVSLSSNVKKGFFSKRGTGKNSKPAYLFELLSNMFNLKYHR